MTKKQRRRHDRPALKKREQLALNLSVPLSSLSHQQRSSGSMYSRIALAFDKSPTYGANAGYIRASGTGPKAKPYQGSGKRFGPVQYHTVQRVKNPGGTPVKTKIVTRMDKPLYQPPEQVKPLAARPKHKVSAMNERKVMAIKASLGIKR